MRAGGNLFCHRRLQRGAALPTVRADPWQMTGLAENEIWRQPCATGGTVGACTDLRTGRAGLQPIIQETVANTPEPLGLCKRVILHGPGGRRKRFEESPLPATVLGVLEVLGQWFLVLLEISSPGRCPPLAETVPR